MARVVVARAAAGRAEEEVRDQAVGAAIRAVAAEARVPAVVVVLAAVAVAAEARVALAARGAIRAAAAVVEVEVRVAGAGPVVVAAAAPEVPAAGVVVVKAVVVKAVVVKAAVVEEAKVRAAARVEAVDRAAATAGVLVAEGIGSSERLAGVRAPASAFSTLLPGPACFIGRDPPAIVLTLRLNSV